MKKRKRKKGRGNPSGKAHTVYFPRVGRVVRLAPARESTTPFCSYYGPHGETCSSTTGLETVGTLPSYPPVVYMACPLHADVVSQTVQAFLERLKNPS
jgi:hypothetical protein